MLGGATITEIRLGIRHVLFPGASRVREGRPCAATGAVGAPMPSAVPPGQTITLKLVATVPSGEGLLRYAPDGTGAAAVWDYVAETD